MGLEQDAERGRLAQALLDNEHYKEAIGKVRQGIIDSWSEAPIRDREGQHELKLMLKLLADIEQNIRQVAETGQLARIEIEREKTLFERAKELAGLR